jgi:SAM-dependent methyltransferase
MSEIEEGAWGSKCEPYVAFGNVQARNDLQSRFEIPLMLRLLEPPRGGRVLEIGCGRGIALPILTTLLAPSSLIGLDIDAELIAIAEERLRTNAIPARVMRGDVRALPLDAGSFDLVIDFGTCYHIRGGADGAGAALREVARVLRPGGLFIHETRVAQRLAHPIRSYGRRLPWKTVPELKPYQRAILWSMRRKQRHD